jgi:uncharacterized coiled-coil protein SlyX
MNVITNMRDAIAASHNRITQLEGKLALVQQELEQLRTTAPDQSSSARTNPWLPTEADKKRKTDNDQWVNFDDLLSAKPMPALELGPPQSLRTNPVANGQNQFGAIGTQA